MLEQVFPGRSEMAARMRELDWSKTSLGPPEGWPQSLRTAVAICISSRFPMFVWWGPELINLYNDAYIPVLGKRHPRGLGVPAQPLWEEIWPVIGPQAEAVMKRGEATWNERVLLVMERNEFAEDTWFTWSYSPIWDETGSVGGLFCACTEETARVLAERERDALHQQLLESEKRFRTMADTAPAMLWITDAHGACTFLSRGWYEFTGQSEAEALGFGWLQAVHPEDFGKAKEDFTTANARRAPFAFDYRVRRKDGEYRWAIDAAAPRFGPEGEYLGFIGSVIDITDRKTAEDELRQLAAELSASDRRKTEFLAMLAHELRNPLAPIRNAAELMRRSSASERGLQNDEKLQSSVEIIERQVSQMVRLVDDLLDVSRISRGTIELRREPTELRSVIGQAVETSRPVIEAAGHELRVALPPDPVYLNADPVRLSQVFCNLLNNASKFSERGGRIGITAELIGPAFAHASLRNDMPVCEVRVRDSGIGIPPEMQRTIFDMFTQVDRTLERSRGGLGIGLTLVENIVTLHGGTIEARSEGVGRGSEFVVRLPTLPSAAEQPAAAPNRDVLNAAGRRRILVVDDNRDSANTLSALLKRSGHDTRAAYDGLEALEAAAAYKPDVILLDIGMPRLNGYDAARLIREQPWGREAILVALTGWGQEEDRQQTRASGFNHHLVKPVDSAELTRLLESIPCRAGASPD